MKKAGDWTKNKKIYRLCNQLVAGVTFKRYLIGLQKGVSKGLKGAPFASQKGVNWKPINALFIFKWLCLNLLHTFLVIVTKLVYTFFTCFLNSFTPPWKFYWFALHSHKSWQWSLNVCSTCSKLVFFLQLTKFNTMKRTETLMLHCSAFLSFVLA